MPKKKTTAKKVSIRKQKRANWWTKIPVLSGLVASIALFVLCGLTIVDAHTSVLGAKMTTTAPPLVLKVIDSSTNGSIHKTYPFAVLAISVDSKPEVKITIPFSTISTEDLSSFGIEDITAQTDIKVRFIGLSKQISAPSKQTSTIAQAVVQAVSNGKYVISPSNIHFNLGDVTNSSSKHYGYCVYKGIPCQFTISLKSTTKPTPALQTCTPKAIDLPYCCGNNMCQMYKNKNCLNSQITISKNVKSCMPTENDGASGPGRHPF